MYSTQIFAKIKVKIKKAILNINQRFQEIATDCEANNKMKFKPKNYNNSDSKNNFNFLLKMFNDWQDLILSGQVFQSMGPWNDIVFRLSEVLHCGTFSSAASDFWNKLPVHLSSIPALPAFRKRIKHHLFLDAFPSIAPSSRNGTPVGNITLSDATSLINITQVGNITPPG